MNCHKPHTVLLALWLYAACVCMLFSQSEPGEPREPLDVLMVGDALSVEVGDHLMGFLGADPRLNADVRVFHTGDDSLVEAWEEDDFLAASIGQGRWHHVILQEKQSLPAFAYLTNHPELYGEGEGPNEAVLFGGEAFWAGGEVVGRAVLDLEGTQLTLFPVWPLAEDDPLYASAFPSDLARPVDMLGFSEASLESLGLLLGNDGGGVVVGAISPLWSHFSEVLEVDVLAEEGLPAFLAAATLYRELVRRPVTDLAYVGPWEAAKATVYREIIDSVLDQLDPLDPVMPPVDPPDEGEEPGEGDNEGEVDPDPNEGTPDPDEEGEGEGTPTEPEIVAENFDVLLAGGAYTSTVQELLLGLFEADPRATLRTLRLLGDAEADLRVLAVETDALASAMADEAWDAVVLEEAHHQGGLAGVYANRRQAFGVGSPAFYDLANYRFMSGGRKAIETVIGHADEPALVFLTPWASQSGHANLELFPPDRTPTAMQAYTVSGHEALFAKALPAGSERLRVANAGAAWIASEEALPELDLYGDDPVFGALAGHYVTAAVLYETITEFSVVGNVFHGGLAAADALALQEIAAAVSGITEREPEPDTPSEEPDPDPDSNEGEPDPNPGAGDGEPTGDPLKVLLLGSAQLALIQEDLEGFLEADPEWVPEVTILTGAHLRALWENAMVKEAVAAGEWDMVILQEDQTFPGLAYMSSQQLTRQYFDVGVPARYSLAEYNFFRAGSHLAKFVLEHTEARLLLSAPWAMDDTESPLTDFPPGEDSAEMHGYTTLAYEQFYDRLPFQHRSRATVVNVGEAWMRSHAAAPTVNLYGQSKADGGVSGHYLAASVLYEALTGKKASQNPYRGAVRPAYRDYLKEISGLDAAAQVSFAGTSTIQSPVIDLGEDGDLVAYVNGFLDGSAPAVPSLGDERLFQSYTSTGTSTWADNWTRELDFSGVAWDLNQAGVLIADQYMVYARHYPRATGSQVTFTDRHGDPVVRRIATQKFLRFDHVDVRTDIMVVRLDEPVPDTVAIYRLVPSEWDPEGLIGAKVVHTYQHRVVSMSEASRFQLFDNDSEVVTTRRNADVVDAAWDRQVIPGDSGHPSFLYVDGELLLFSTHTFTGFGSKGPYYGGIGNQDKILRAMAELAPADD